MKLIKSSLLAVMALLTFSACNSDKDPQQTVDYYYGSNLSFVTDLTATPGSEGATALYSGADYTIRYDLTASTATVSIANLQLTPNLSRVVLSLDDVPFGMDETGAVSISVPSATSVSGGQIHTINGFSLRQLTRSLPAVGSSTTYFEISYTVDERYDVRVVMQYNTFDGTTKLINLSDGTFSLKTEPYYGYYLDLSKGVAKVSMGNLTIDGRYFQTLTVEDLPFTVDASGISIEGPEIVYPMVNGTIDRTIHLTGFKVSGTYKPTLNVEFDYNLRYRVEAALTSLRTSAGQ